MKKPSLGKLSLLLYILPIILMWGDIPMIWNHVQYLSGTIVLIFWLCLIYASVYFSTSVYRQCADQVDASRLIIWASRFHLFALLIALLPNLIRLFCYLPKTSCDVGAGLMIAFLSLFGFFVAVFLYVVGLLFLIVYKIRNHPQFTSGD